MNTTKYNDFEEKNRKAELGGGADKIEKQHAAGKMTARERINLLVDKDSFVELDKLVTHHCTNFGMEKNKLAGDAMVSGYGKIDGRLVFVYAYDFTAYGGSLGAVTAQKIVKVQKLALKNGAPVIALNDSGGARIQEGIESLNGYSEIFYQNIMASGVVPQISAILGPCAGGAVYSPALTDFVFVVDNISKMFITGPEVVKSVLGEEVSMENLGGARIHAEVTGNAHFFANNEQECFDQIKKLVTFIPWNNRNKAEKFAVKSPRISNRIENIMPQDPSQPYDVRDIIRSISDDSDFFEVQEMWAANIVVGFARINGDTVGIVANQPLVMAGVLDVDSSDKGARFIRFCDAFNIPLVTLVDLPGYLPGVDQEHAGVIRHGAKLLYSYSEATVPKITLILRKAYGGGYIAMCSRHLGADFVFAWPTAEIAVMGPEGAANIIFRKEIMSAKNPDEMRKLKVQEYTEKFANPYVAAANGYIDAVVKPEETRGYIVHALEISREKQEIVPQKKHGIPPF